MSRIHTIRLHGPWVARLTDHAGSSQAEIETERRVTIPMDGSEWPSLEYQGQVEFRRSFRMPTQLTDHQRVFLVIDVDGIRASCVLNGEMAGSLQTGDRSFRVEVRKRLLPSNVILIIAEYPDSAKRVSSGPVTTGCIRAVRLEIEEGEEKGASK